MLAFVTGSRAYGTPRPDSDVDLVILTSADDMKLLCAVSTCFDDSYDGSSASLRFGDLNLLVFCDEELFNAWRNTHAELCAMKPVTRDLAIAAFKRAITAVNEKRT